MTPHPTNAALFLLGALIVGIIGCGCSGNERRYENTPASYVGGAACYSCHQAETTLWTESHHDLAMQEASDSTILGNFDNTRFEYAGITSEFYTRDGEYYVRTDGPDGLLQEYKIAYTFGAIPLQQYLIAFPDGRYQMLGIAWDTHIAEEGGQRWFHLYPDENVTFDDPLHWTGPNQNWNYMCADCHSTNLEKNYSLAEDRFETTWTDIDVSCESCHGPGSVHVDWAKAHPDGAPVREGDQMGLAVRLKDLDEGLWFLNPEEFTAKRSPERQSNVLVETCAYCHSRRGMLHDNSRPGQPLMDAYRPALLDEGLYHPDGQILDEVFVYGSFIQSKMYRSGVTCSNCHDAHSLHLKAKGNDLCSSCHLSTKYNTPEHHFHKPESTGAQCVECHMPEQTYMVVDPRRDHSLRSPRPDLTEKLGAPNACNQCHPDKSVAWSIQYYAQWYGPETMNEIHFGEIIRDGRLGIPEAGPPLAELANDPEQAGIVRATALSALGGYSGSFASQAVRIGLQDNDPLARWSALRMLEASDPGTTLRLAFPLLTDSIRSVRIEAARLLASVPAQNLTATQGLLLDEVVEEYMAAERMNADRPEAHLNIGVLHMSRGAFTDAESSFQTALRILSTSVRARINLADLYRLIGRENDGEAMLREAIDIEPEAAETHHALGLLLVRQRRIPEALEALRSAAALQPETARFSYVYGIALHSTGDIEGALSVLDEAALYHPSNRDILLALVTINRDNGNRVDALRHAQNLVAVFQEDPLATQLLEQLENL